MSNVLVTSNGGYHGHNADISHASKIKSQNPRFVSNQEWEKIANAPREQRAELCSTLGNPVF
jgi:hypothetical protein